MTNLNKVWAIVPAAGSGNRMNTSVAKQYLQILGKTILEHTLERLLKCGELEGIIVCLSESDESFKRLEISKHPKVKSIIGGVTRANSVLNGLRFLQAKAHQDDWVLVHDAARPCLRPELISAMIEQLENDAVGGILAIPAKDTLKRANADQIITETIDRTAVWQAQTPQMFRIGLLTDSLTQALQKGFEITDEASALEWAGYSPRLIEGDAANIKITTPEDLSLAEFLLSHKSSTIPS